LQEVDKTYNAVPMKANQSAGSSAKLERPRNPAVLLRCGPLLAMLFCLGFLLHSPSLAARSEWIRVSPGLTSGANFAIADFDGDRLPDVATVETGPSEAAQTRYWIQFAFGRGSRTGVAVSGPTGGLQIASQDVNGDSFQDLIVSTELANEPIAVLLNDGAGNFRLADVSKFDRAIWDSRVEWRVNSTCTGQSGLALVGGGWNVVSCGDRRGLGLRPGQGAVALGSEELNLLVTPSEVRGRAPPLA
jgi:hypothetical protein